MRWSAGEGEAPTSYLLTARAANADETLTYASTDAANAGELATDVVISGLRNGVEYSVVVYAMTEAGRSEASAAATATPTSGVEGVVAGIIVGFESGAAPASGSANVPGEAAVTGVDLTVGADVAGEGTLVELSEPVSVSEAQIIASELERDAEVAWAEPDIVLTPASAATDPEFQAQQWNLWGDAGVAGKTEAGQRPSVAVDARAGAGVTVAVIDTGITTHPDLQDQTVPGYDFVSDVPALASAREPGADPVAFDGDYLDAAAFGVTGRDPNATDPGDWNHVGAVHDSTWHGTQMAGIIAALADNGIGIAGLAPSAKILPIRALSWRGGLLSDIADSVTWASGGAVSGAPENVNRASVINLSFSAKTTCPRVLQEAISAARSRGSVLVAAAGNAGEDASLYAPGNCEGVITVAASDQQGQRAGFSNYGSRIDLSAPGVAIAATGNDGSTIAGTPSIVSGQGTSQAAAHVSAVAARLLSTSPTSTPDQIEKALTGSVRAFSSTGCDADPAKTCGAGILDLSLAQVATASTARSLVWSQNSAGSGLGKDIYGCAEASCSSPTRILAGSGSINYRYPQISPDGSKLLYLAVDGSGSLNTDHIEYSNRDGSGIHRVLDATDSPIAGGQRIEFPQWVNNTDFGVLQSAENILHFYRLNGTAHATWLGSCSVANTPVNPTLSDSRLTGFTNTLGSLQDFEVRTVTSTGEQWIVFSLLGSIGGNSFMIKYSDCVPGGAASTVTPAQGKYDIMRSLLSRPCGTVIPCRGVSLDPQGSYVLMAMNESGGQNLKGIIRDSVVLTNSPGARSVRQQHWNTGTNPGTNQGSADGLERKTGNVSWPVRWSPDGNRVAYVKNVGAAGSTIELLTRAEVTGWVPSGSSITSSTTVSTAGVMDLSYGYMSTQTLTFAQPADQTYSSGGTFTVTAPTSDSGLTVTLTSSTTGVCTVGSTTSGVTTINMISAGTCTLSADQSGNYGYDAATSVVRNVSLQGIQAALSISSGGSKVYGSDLTLTTSGGTGGGAVTYSVTTAGAAGCSIVGATLSTTGNAGTSCGVTATKAASGAYQAISSSELTITVSQASQTVTLSAPTPASPTYSVGGTFSLSGSSGSGLSVTLSSATSSVCSVAGTTVTILTAGTCTIAGDQSGGTNYLAAAQVTRNIVIAKASQTITSFPAVSGRAYVASEQIALSATSSSGLTPSYSSSTTSVCTVSGSTVTVIAAGTCSLSATQAGNVNYDPVSTAVSMSFVISPASQALSLSGPSSQVFAVGGTFAVTATSSAGLTPVVTSITTSVCTVSGLTVTTLSTGTCTVAANQAGTANVGAASQTTMSVTITAGVTTFAWSPTTNVLTTSSPVGAGGAVAVSGEVVSYSIIGTNTAGCSVNPTTGSLAYTGAGSCTVQALAGANANYDAGATTRTFTVSRQSQPVSINDPGSQAFAPNATFAITYSAGGSGQAVIVTSMSPSVCVVSGTTVTTIAAGTCMLSAFQPGNGQWADGSDTLAVTIDRGTPSLTWSTTTTAYANQSPFAMTGTPASSSGGAITYSVASAGTTGCSVDSSTGTVTFTGVGSGTNGCRITATTAVTSNYNQASTSVTIRVQLTPASLQLNDPGPITYSETPTTLTWSTQSTVAIGWSVVATPAGACTVVSGAVTLHALGSCTVTATQAGSSIYASDSSSRTFSVLAGSPPIVWPVVTSQATADAGYQIPPVSSFSTAVVTYAVAAGSSGCALDSQNFLTWTGEGSCSVTATVTDPQSLFVTTQETRTITVSTARSGSIVASILSALGDLLPASGTPVSQDPAPMSGPNGTVVEVAAGDAKYIYADGDVVDTPLSYTSATELTAGTPGDFQMLLDGNEPGAAVVDTVEGKLIFNTGKEGLATGKGFAPGTQAEVWLFSDHIFLGYADVAGDGTFSKVFTVPADIAIGNHTVQAEGLDHFGEQRAVAAGVLVRSGDAQRVVKKRIIVTFDQLSTDLPPKQRARLRALLKKDLVSVTARGYVQASGDTANDRSLSKKRARIAAVMARGLSENVRVSEAGMGRKQSRLAGCQAASNRCAVITVTYRVGAASGDGSSDKSVTSSAGTAVLPSTQRSARRKTAPLV